MEFRFVKLRKNKKQVRKECLDPTGATYNYPVLYPCKVTAAANKVMTAYITNSINAGLQGGWNKNVVNVLMEDNGNFEVKLYSGELKRTSGCLYHAGGQNASVPLFNPAAVIDGVERGVRWTAMNGATVTQEKKAKKLGAEDSESLASIIQRHLDAAAAISGGVADVAELIGNIPIIGKFLPLAPVVAKYAEGVGDVAAVLSGVLGWIMGQLKPSDTPDGMDVEEKEFRYVYVPGIDDFHSVITYDEPDNPQSRLDSLEGAKKVNDITWAELEVYRIQDLARFDEVIQFMIQCLGWLKSYFKKMYDVDLIYLFELDESEWGGLDFEHVVYNEYVKYFQDLFAWALEIQMDSLRNKQSIITQPQEIIVTGGESDLTAARFDEIMRMCFMLPSDGLAPSVLPDSYNGQQPLISLIQYPISQQLGVSYDDDDNY